MTSKPDLFVWYLVPSKANPADSPACHSIYRRYKKELSSVEELLPDHFVGVIVLDRCISAQSLIRFGDLEKHWEKFVNKYRTESGKPVFVYRSVYQQAFRPIVYAKPSRGSRNNDFKLLKAHQKALEAHIARIESHFSSFTLTHRGLVVDKRMLKLLLLGLKKYEFRRWKRHALYLTGPHYIPRHNNFPSASV